jgi:neutral ceramidase
MKQPHDVKAGPSQPQPRWIQQTSRWRRQIVKAIALVAALMLGYMAFVRLSRSSVGINWIWRTTSQDGNEHERESAKGSQYLLGLGKADITGFEIRNSSRLD